MFVSVKVFIETKVRECPLVLRLAEIGRIFGVIIPAVGKPGLCGSRRPSRIEEIIAIVYVSHGDCCVATLF